MNVLVQLMVFLVLGGGAVCTAWRWSEKPKPDPTPGGQAFTHQPDAATIPLPSPRL